MQFNLLTLLGSAALVAANTVTFKSLDDVSRTVHFTPNSGLASVDSVEVPAGGEVKVNIPTSWIGNWYSVSEGSENVAGMLGEVAFNGWNGLTYFDVSAIVNPNDHNGVKKMWPASGDEPVSGCDWWPCNNAYYLPDDVQTKVTSETDLICTLGNNGVTSRRDIDDHHESPNYKRDFVISN
ncbi:DNase1 protein [Colletotrichum scovillei]|uniref:DNase1 protein n=5 Tax=Colletotrichum acutatum species complex TaxID=2707335 RepID=A0A9P7RGV8_9PEZI|nr:DNase1 protein [Colletotrichum scovillei]KAK0381967.1 DNase1 protein [Colletotrichum limetticola]KAK1454001.1 DNase1 protein [Colletotrichum melonis]KAK1494737.1 DNase1 protein [Colletotrichum cuscutae]KXH43143.1 DNase1 protein [Colletotrichum simmondsii]KAF4779966.1 DNase1 protein [Colletotrichum scovillei]